MQTGFFRREKNKVITPKGFFRREKNQLSPPTSPTSVSFVLKLRDVLDQSISDSVNSSVTDPMSTSHTRSFDKESYDFATARGIHSALLDIMKDIDLMEMYHDADSHPGFAELRQKILECIACSKPNDDKGLLYLLDNKKNDDFVDECNDEAPASVLSSKQLFDLTLSSLRAQIETMEERNLLIARIQALEKLLTEQHITTDCLPINRKKLDTNTQSVQVTTKLLQKVESLQRQLQEKQATIETVTQERDSHEKSAQELSRILRSVGPRTSNAGSDDDYVPDDVMPEQGEVITPDRALHLTITHLMKIIEVLEDERHGFMADIHTLGSTVNELKQEKEARELKISVLENQFDLMEKHFEVMDAAMREGPLTCNFVEI